VAGWADPGWNAFTSEVEGPRSTVEYSEADHEDSAELLEGDK
jgi:hypothetical protein